MSHFFLNFSTLQISIMQTIRVGRQVTAWHDITADPAVPVRLPVLAISDVFTFEKSISFAYRKPFVMPLYSETMLQDGY